MSDLLLQAMTARQNGDISLARQLLSQAIIQNPKNEAAWMMMSEVVDEVKLRRNCLERVLSINPGNTAASVMLTKLNTSPLGPITRGERDKPLDPPNLEKVPPFTPPFTWNSEEEQYLALGEVTFPDLTDEEKEKPAETVPTFDWATESESPDKTIDKIFEAMTSPGTASEIPSEPVTNSSEENPEDGEVLAEPATEQETQDRWLDELVGNAAAPEAEQSAEKTEDFMVSAEPQLGMEAFASTEAPEPVATNYLLWDNPKTKEDRLIILTNKSLIYASPAASDIPHIIGLFAEQKMLRDLLGENAGVIPLESIRSITVNPKTASATVNYLLKEKPASHSFDLSGSQALDELMAGLNLRVGSGFSETIREFKTMDKIGTPLALILIILVLGWGLIAGVPMLFNVPGLQTGILYAILLTLERFRTGIGFFYIILVGLICILLGLIWLISNLFRPSKLIYYERL